MADITVDYLNNIKGLAEKSLVLKKIAEIKTIQNGKDVRQPVVVLLKYINENGPDASTFMGLTSDAYVKEDGTSNSLSCRVEKIKIAWAKDGEARADSRNLIMTQGITKVIGLLNEGWPATKNS